jgi:hypothetical protein
MSEHALLFAKSDDDVGFSMFAPPICKGGDGGTTLSVPPDPTKTAATQRTSQRAERAIKRSAMREQLTSKTGLAYDRGARCGTSTMDEVWR